MGNDMLNRTIAPKIVDAVEFELGLPLYEKKQLKNGVEVYAINLGTQETMMVNWVFNAGNWYEEKNLVAAATNYLIKNGTSSRDAFAINEHFEFFGSYLNRTCQNETAEITLHCLSRHASSLLPAVAELIQDSIFPEEELNIFRKNMQQRLEVSLMKSDFVAGRLIDSYLFGEHHPYGRFSTQADYASLEREELRIFFEEYYKHGSCVIFVAGRLPENILEEIESNFGSLPIKPLMTSGFKPMPITPAKSKKYSIVNDPQGVQGAIRIARNFPNRHHPDFQKAQVLNHIFGGFFGSRLMANIREDKGYTYGIYSYLVNQIQDSAWMISTEAGKEVCDATITEIYREMKLLCDEPVSKDELQTARNAMIGTILGDLDGPFQVLGRWKNILLNQLDEKYFYRGIEIIKTISAEELRELARKYFEPDNYYELVVY
jgi:zinc protease